MHAKVLFFGLLKDVVDRPQEDIELPEGADLRSVFDLYAARYPRLADLSRSIVMARNQEFAELSTRVAEGDELAFLPPVSGGASPAPEALDGSGNYYAL